MKAFAFSTFLSTVISLCSVTTVHAFTGKASWYRTGLGNCGAYSADTDFIVAVSTLEYKGGIHCWQHVYISRGDKTITAVVADSCPGCGLQDLDLSPAAFQALGSLDEGVISVNWWFA